jgi:WD40 repeat protein
MAYFRSVAETMADAAEALHRVHNAGVIHRDLKPANLMLEADGNSWVIDFGLAGFLNGQTSDGTRIRVTKVEPEALTTTGILGTPPYMSPEQWDSQSSVLTDIWSLGATLYELLTLHQAFHGTSLADVRAAVVGTEPVSPRTHVRNIPADLSAICLKALRKEPSQRYRSARELAEDLRRWLRYESTIARPARAPRRMFMWSRRNPGWASAILLTVLTCLAVTWTLILHQENLRAKAENDHLTALANAAEAHRLMELAAVYEDMAWAETERASQAAKSAVERAEAAEKQGRIQRRGLLIQNLQGIRLGPHVTFEHLNWSDDAWQRVRDARQFGISEELRDHAAATLIGLDAHFTKRMKGFGASSVAWDRTGVRLAIGGWVDPQKKVHDAGRVWDAAADSVAMISQLGPGPVAYRADGTPIQAIIAPKDDDPRSILLWDMSKDRSLGKFTIPGQEKHEISACTLSPDSTLLAAGTASSDGKEGVIAVWDTRSGKLVRTFTKAATAIDITPDRTLLAAGDENGCINVWTLEGGAHVGMLSSDRHAIHSLAFGRDVRQGLGKKKAEAGSGWLLAAGSAGASVVVWDLEKRLPRIYCHGSPHAVYAVAFSPDGTTLASTGRGYTRLWELASGQQLLSIQFENYLTGLSFTPDGRRLAVSAFPAHGSPGGVYVLDLEPGRGILTLRGLGGRLESQKLRYSPDGVYLAALSHEWRVAIWEAKTGRLVRVLDVPIGPHSDNAGLAFSHDNKSFAFSSGREARLWDMASGEERRTWTLPPGLSDQLAFQPSGKLLLFRQETEAADRYPDTAAHPTEHPRVCRIREMPLDGPPKELAVKEDLNWHVFEAVAAPDGSFFAAVGIHEEAETRERTLKIWEGTTGQELWSYQGEDSNLALDATGHYLVFTQGRARNRMLELPSSKRISEVKGGAVSPNLRYTCDRPDPFGLELFRREDGKLLVHLGIDKEVIAWAFHPAGTHFAWGNADGSVMVCDIAEVQRRLASVGLGW